MHKNTKFFSHLALGLLLIVNASTSLHGVKKKPDAENSSVDKKKTETKKAVAPKTVIALSAPKATPAQATKKTKNSKRSSAKKPPVTATANAPAPKELQATSTESVKGKQVTSLPMKTGDCFICCEKETQLVILGCNHALQCMKCSRDEIQTFYNNGHALEFIPCHYPGCNHLLVPNEITFIIGTNPLTEPTTAPIIATLYEGIIGEEPDEYELDAIARHELQICPRCKFRSIREMESACNYMYCLCGQNFCFYCGIALCAVNHGNHYLGFATKETLVGDGSCPLFGIDPAKPLGSLDLALLENS